MRGSENLNTFPAYDDTWLYDWIHQAKNTNCLIEAEMHKPLARAFWLETLALLASAYV